MDYDVLLDMATDLGYQLAMSGAETFRVEDSIHHVLNSYGIDSEVFAIPNFLIVNIKTPEGKTLTRMRRIGYHGNNLDAVEKLNALSRAICETSPRTELAAQWLDTVLASVKKYSRTAFLIGDILGAAGFGVLFGCNGIDTFFAGICGLIIGLVTQFTDSLKTNPFFSTLASSFLMAIAAYSFNVLGWSQNADAVNIGALMILVPGLLFTNSLRDIIYGDTNSGINRIVQVFLIAIAISLGTAFAHNVISHFWIMPVSSAPIDYPLQITCIAAFVGCIGFSILFNIHGAGGMLCAIGGAISWIVFIVTYDKSGSALAGYFWGTTFSALYSEIMARIRKFPTTSYIVVSIFPLLPGASIYYTMRYALDRNMDGFLSKGIEAVSIAGTMAVSILLVSTLVRLYTTWLHMRKLRNSVPTKN